MASIEASLVLDAALGRVAQVLTPSLQEWDRRQKLVDEHVALLSRQLNSPHPIQISTFGSSLSGLCLANSDVDLGLFGRVHDSVLEDLRPHQQQGLLRLVLKAVQAAKLAKNQVQAIWGARIPVLKYTCRLSGLDCDISLQGTGALVKARFIHILNSSSRQLPALYRLVKLWAQAHDLNDASRSTFNSTSLLYMTVFYLQQLQLLPPLQELVPQELLLQPGGRLLQGRNKLLWEEPQRLQQLLAAVQDRMRAWVAQQQQAAPGLSQLLLGFFQLWSGALTDWVLGRNRHLHADLWRGTWAPGSFMKQYIFSLQDPFDATDCPARAVGSNTNTNGGTAAFIAYMFSSSSKVMQRYTDRCGLQGSDAAAQGSGSRCAGWFEDWEQQATSNVAPAVPGVRMELCKLVAWLFGPKGTLLLGCYEQQRQQEVLAAAPWATAPFPQSMIEAVQQYQRQNMKPAKLLTWVVEQLEAELDKDRNILCLNQLGLLTKQISEAATAAAMQARGARHHGVPQQHASAATAGTQHDPAADALQHLAVIAQASSSPAQTPRGGDTQQNASNSSSNVPLQGLCLQEPDSELLRIQQLLRYDLENLQHKCRTPPGKTPPKRLPKAVRTAVQMSLTAVIRRISQLQHLQDSSSSSSSNGSAFSSYGLLAVLQQHNFNELLEEWGFMTHGVIWKQVLPSEALDNSGSGSQSVANIGSSSNNSAADIQQEVQPASDAVASQAAATAPHAARQPAAAAAPAATSAASGSGSSSTLTLTQLLAPRSGQRGFPSQSLKYMYKVVRTAAQHQLAVAEAAGHSRHSQAAAMACAAAATGQPKFAATQRSSAGGKQQWYGVLRLPELVSISTAADGSVTARQIIPPGTERVKPLKGREQVDSAARSALARDALNWLGSQPGVVAAVREAIQLVQEQQQLQSQQLVATGHQSGPDDVPLPPGKAHHGERVVTGTQQQTGGSSSAATGAVVTAAGVAATGAAPALTGEPNSPGSSSSRSTMVVTGTSHEHQQQQKQQRRHGKKPAVAVAAAGANQVTKGLATLTLADGVDNTTDPAATAAAPPSSQAAAEAVHAAYRWLRDVQSNIKHLEKRIVAKQQKLEADNMQLESLQQEELLLARQASAAAKTEDRQASSSSSKQLASTGASDAHGDWLLTLAMQQSMQEKLKQTRHDVNNAKSRLRSNTDALRQFQVNLWKLQKQEEDAVAALQSAEAQLAQLGT